MKLQSKFESLEDRMVKFLNADADLLAAWLEDTLNPSLSILNIKIILNEFLGSSLENKEKNPGNSKILKTIEKLEKALEHCNHLDKVATQNNTFQLIFKQKSNETRQLREEVKKLKDENKSMKEAWEKL